jgi:hypothetical protein
MILKIKKLAFNFEVDIIRPKIKKTINPLFEQWKTEMAERSFSRYMDVPPVSNSWLHWLIEASLDHKKKKEWFMRKLNGRLRELKKDKKTFKKQWLVLARLTTDLPNFQGGVKNIIAVETWGAI